MREPLDYQTPPPSPRARVIVGRIVQFTAWALLAPSILLVATELLIDPVHRHWITGYEINQVIILVCTICNILGVIAGVVATVLGQPMGWFVAVLHILSLFFMPAFEYG